MKKKRIKKTAVNAFQIYFYNWIKFSLEYVIFPFFIRVKQTRPPIPPKKTFLGTR